MAEEWLTYQDLGERLGISAEAARQKAIRGHWPRRTANDGKTQVRVDVEDVRAVMPVRKLKDESPSDDRPPPDEHPVEQALDAQTLAALEAHIETLKAMAAKAEQIAAIERERANGEQARANRERDRADAERERANDISDRLEAAHRDAAKAQARLADDISDLKAKVLRIEQPWWKRLVG